MQFSFFPSYSIKIFMRYLLLPIALVVSACQQPHFECEPGVEEIVTHQLCLFDLIDHELSAPLTIESASLIALIQSAKIQALYSEVGISQAESFEATLFNNPILGGALRFPNSSGPLNSEATLLASLLDPLIAPKKRAAFESKIESVRLNAASEVLYHLFMIQEKIILLSSKKTLYAIQQKLSTLADCAEEIAYAQLESQNIDDVSYDAHMLRHLREVNELTQLEIEIAELTEDLNALMGFDGGSRCWSVAEELPTPQEPHYCLEDLQNRAINERLDLQALAFQLESEQRKTSYSNWWAHTNLYLGPSVENDSDGILNLGAEGALTLPIFNWGQGERAIIYANRQKMLYEMSNLETEISTETASQLEQLKRSYELFFSHDREILPLQERRFKEAFTRYNSMLFDLFELLSIKADLMKEEMELINARAQFWLTYIALEKSIGGVLPCGDY